MWDFLTRLDWSRLDWINIVENTVSGLLVVVGTTLIAIFRKQLWKTLVRLGKLCRHVAIAFRRKLHFLLRIRYHISYLRHLIPKYRKLLADSRNTTLQLEQLLLQHPQESTSLTEPQLQLLPRMVGRSEAIDIYYFAKDLQWDLDYAEVIATQLEAAGLIYCHRSMDGTECCITNKGRELLISLGILTQNGLVKY